MHEIQNLKAKRWDALDAIDRMLNAAHDAEGHPRDLTPHENGQFEKLKLDIEKCDSQITMLEAEAMRKAASAVRPAPAVDHPDAWPSQFSPAIDHPDAWPSASQFSLSRLIAAACGIGDAPHEMAVCKQLARQHGVSERGVKIPLSLAKAQTVGSAPAGGFLVPDGAGPLIDRLTETSLISRLPITRLAAPAGVGSVNLPRVASGTSGAWIGETATVPESSLQLGMISLTPRLAGLRASFSRMLLATSSPSIESVVVRDLGQSLTALVDNALLNSDGVGNSPLGVLSQGQSILESSYANLWNALAAGVKTLEAANVSMANARWLVSPATALRLRTEFKADPADAVQGQFIAPESAGLMGIPVVVSNYCPDATAVLADWSDVILMQWGSGDLLIDQYSAAETGMIKVVLYLMVDCAIRHSASLVKIGLSS